MSLVFVHAAHLVYTNEGVLGHIFAGASVQVNQTIVFLALQYVLEWNALKGCFSSILSHE